MVALCLVSTSTRTTLWGLSLSTVVHSLSGGWVMVNHISQQKPQLIPKTKLNFFFSPSSCINKTSSLSLCLHRTSLIPTLGLLIWMSKIQWNHHWAILVVLTDFSNKKIKGLLQVGPEKSGGKNGVVVRQSSTADYSMDLI